MTFTTHSWHALAMPTRMVKSLLTTSLLAAGLAAAGHALAQDLPGKGIKVQPLQSSIAEETFQTLLVNKAMQKLGYEVLPIREVEYATAHVAIGNGDATYMADHWDPLQADFYKNAGGADKLYREGEYSTSAVQGYLIDKKTADAHKITNIEQLKDPKIAKLFDTDGDGKADLTGCTPGWGCEGAIEHQLTAYQLRDTVTHVQGTYAALMADTISRFKADKPILYYTWTPYWVSAELRPGRDVVWLQVPFTALPGNQADLKTALPNGKNYGFPLNTQKIVANKKFAEANPAAAKLFATMKLPVSDINAQNLAMKDGQNKPADIERHADGWIKAHQAEFDGWIKTALDAAKAQ
ncbi:glycine betaine/proline transport system substrate-binding protein [Comamonas sp. BIGb0152]|nr:glycine betaine/proline transport system substrate-binding protein [Comamonas sp. BIGb0152]